MLEMWVSTKMDRTERVAWLEMTRPTPQQTRGSHMRLERRALKNAQLCRHNAKNQVRKAASVLGLYSSRIHEIPPKSAIEYSMERLQSALEWQQLAEMADLKALEHFERQKVKK